MHYREIQPNAAAARFVKCYWLLEDGEPPPSIQRVVPDGRAQLILNLGHPYEALTERGWQRQPRRFFIGQITAPLLLRATGPFRMIGINFHPHAASQLLGIPMCELTDTAAISLDDFSGGLFRQLDRIEVLAFAVKELELVGGLTSVAAVANHVGLSSRQFQRRFIEAVGIAPKLFCRIQRFQRVFSILENDGSGWADAAVRCGYYDQAHLIRDVREFAGKTPIALLAEETDLARHFLQSNSMSHFSKTSVDSWR
jgi:AraC-like DNA-binding protein